MIAKRMRQIALPAGPVIAVLVALALHSQGFGFDVAVTAMVTVWCVLWWVFEPIPIPVTSLLPLALLPLLGVLTPAQVGQAYGSPLILLLLGGFILSKAMEHSGAHRRIALNMVRLFGGHSDRSLVFGFMAASAFLSMWISNTATTLMLLPVALAVLEKVEGEHLSAPLLLGVAYAASVGGIGTPIGTPPNLIFMQVYQENTGTAISFSQWMSWGIPVVIVLVPVIALWLTRNLAGGGGAVLPQVGAWRSEERRVMWVFAFTALAWITRSEPFGGWSGALGLSGANDASVALVAVVVMFLVPSGRRDGEALLTWERAVTIPWGVLLLFSGGICLAKGFVSSGLSVLMGDWLASMSYLPIWLLIGLICLVVSFMTETTSNTASTTLLMPILAAAALAAGIAPEVLMVPAAMTASCAFMLPVATAPNSVVYGSGKVPIVRMAREGFALNLLAVVIIAGLSFVNLA